MERPLCPLCKLHYNEIQRIPKKLECGHQMCLCCCNENQLHFTQLLCPIDYTMFLNHSQQLPNDTQILEKVKYYSYHLEKSNYLQAQVSRFKEKMMQDQNQVKIQCLKNLNQQFTQQIQEEAKNIQNRIQDSRNKSIQKVFNYQTSFMEKLQLQNDLNKQKQKEITQIKFAIASLNYKSSNEI